MSQARKEARGGAKKSNMAGKARGKKKEGGKNLAGLARGGGQLSTDKVRSLSIKPKNHP